MPCAAPRQRSASTERCTSFSTSTGHGNERCSRLRERHALPAAELRRQRQPPGSGIDDAGRADPDRLSLVRIDLRPPRAPSAAAARTSSSSASAIRASRRALTRRRSVATHVAVQVGDQDEQLVGADVDAEHVAEIGTEPEQARRGPGRRGSAGRRRALSTTSRLEQDSRRRSLTVGFESPIDLRQLGARDRPVARGSRAEPAAELIRRRSCG